MQPGDGFWEGVGQSVGSSPGWMVVGTALVMGILFIVAKYIVPSRERIKMRELDIREQEAKNKADDIKVKAGMTEQMGGLRISSENLATQTAAMNARLSESALRSHEMGGKVDRIDATTKHTDTLVQDLHEHFFREGTD